MSWDKYENNDGTITLCYMEWDESWGNWGECVLTMEQYSLWVKGDKDIEEYVWGNLK